MGDSKFYELSKAQLGQYFDRIRLPQESRATLDRDVLKSLSPTEQLKALLLLQRFHLRSVPFENISLHYSWHRVINVEPKFLFDKMVVRGRGGYCMEQNTLFNTILLNLGFDAYMAGSRVYNPNFGRFGGFDHCVNIVTVHGNKFVADVGFGSNGPILPLGMDGTEDEVDHLGQAKMRLRHAPIPQALNQEAKFWIYEQKLEPTANWTPMYCFTDVEFLPEDIQIMNLKPSTTLTSIFVQRLIATRFVTSEDVVVDDNGTLKVLNTDQCRNVPLDGQLILEGNTAKLRRNGEKVFEKVLESEAARVDFLQAVIGHGKLELSEAEREAIKGTAAAIL
ncbi:hypothetical protein FSOLCH5_005139 [Fusarium solani]|jgi:arylamine N-acetyltransferase|uniref:Arylamine N-acetyltransferase n=1 Tax=Fusarium solani TaxID=169388 RepID=A0A9P9L8Y1_FUSSL|nr:uncharacterized protein B0J15DRAFT_476631 [Fusarium solani]KAH7276176.1 hypothetical protein B0J15DRAFT_476631 [Fusarium solani]KAJ4223347.1 hypothetical protein NW759_005980 [Fusarium solani]